MSLLCGLSCGWFAECSEERCEGCAAASREGNSVRKCGEDGGGSGTHPPGPVPATTPLLDDVVCKLIMTCYKCT